MPTVEIAATATITNSRVSC